MPELDRFERNFGAGWRRAFNYARNGDSSDGEIGDVLIKSLAKTLRDRGGIPGFDELIGIVCGRTGLNSIEAFTQLDRIVRNHGGHRHTKIGAEIVKAVMVVAELDSMESPTNPTELAEQICVRILDHEYFDRARAHLIELDKLQSHEDSRQWQHRVLRQISPAVSRVAEQVVKDPKSLRLRAPKRTVPIKSTAELLHEDLRLAAKIEIDTGPNN